MADTEELCKEGDTLYRLSKNGIAEVTVLKIEHYPHSVYKLSGGRDSCFNRAFGKTIFKTYEEANRARHIKSDIIKKREMLKEYETKLNEQLGLGDHRIIK